MMKLKKISKIEQQKYNKNRYSIFLENKYAFSVSEDTLIEYRLLKGKEIDDKFIEDVLIAEEKNKAKLAALNYLGYKMRTEKEIINKLISLGYDDYIDYVINYLKNNRYIDDREYALAFSKEKMNLKGFGKIRINLELKEKGVNTDTIDSVLEEIGYYDNEYDNAVKMAEKRLNRSYKDDRDRYRKIYSFLLRNGYSIDLIKKVLNELL